jgi:hypothetical protein
MPTNITMLLLSCLYLHCCALCRLKKNNGKHCLIRVGTFTSYVVPWQRGAVVFAFVWRTEDLGSDPAGCTVFRKNMLLCFMT